MKWYEGMQLQARRVMNISEGARSAAARLCRALIQAGGVLDGFETEFSELEPHIHSAASRRDR